MRLLHSLWIMWILNNSSKACAMLLNIKTRTVNPRSEPYTRGNKEASDRLATYFFSSAYRSTSQVSFRSGARRCNALLVSNPWKAEKSRLSRATQASATPPLPASAASRKITRPPAKAIRFEAATLPRFSHRSSRRLKTQPGTYRSTKMPG